MFHLPPSHNVVIKISVLACGNQRRLYLLNWLRVLQVALTS